MEGHDVERCRKSPPENKKAQLEIIFPVTMERLSIKFTFTSSTAWDEMAYTLDFIMNIRAAPW